MSLWPALRTWRLKAGVQRFLAAAPMGDHAYRLLQRAGGLRTRHPQAYVDACVRILDAVGGPGRLAGARSVEVGTGWNVNLPLALHLCGAGPCDTFDASRHCHPREALRSARLLGPALSESAGEGEARRAIDRRWTALQHLGWPALLENTSISYHAPADAGRSGLGEGTVDLVFSRSVLQHIPPDVLERIFLEAARILKPGGRMWHFLDLNDQFRMVDRGLSRIHHLSFSDEEWQKVAGNRFAYTNRLRISDFVGLARKAGFEAEVQRARVDPLSIAFARSGGVHPEFASRDDADLGTFAADLVCSKP